MEVNNTVCSTTFHPTCPLLTALKEGIDGPNTLLLTLGLGPVHTQIIDYIETLDGTGTAPQRWTDVVRKLEHIQS